MAAGALPVAPEMLEDNPLRRLEPDASLPLVTPVKGRSAVGIEFRRIPYAATDTHNIVVAITATSE